ncbi:type II toxin-antitoxin system VapC family toxin [Arthrobacter sp. USHLN218]|uniref:type II toxin-antitoxin system VapC family toxin n=1 Tax=Arthrobacter sp. USHLN218 TaxID=3081232 RepID=UPI00301ADA5E
MTRFVIGPDVALQLARDRARIAMTHQLVAPTLLRSQVLSVLYREVQSGAMESHEAERQLDYLRGLRIRLLGDRALQRAAWKVANELGWPDTFEAEYVALTQLQADAFVTLDQQLARAARKLVKLAEPEALFVPAGSDSRPGSGGGHQPKLRPLKT